MAVICLIVKSSNALAKVLLFVRRLEVGHHLAEVVEEGAELDEVEVDTTSKSIWEKAVAKEETESNLAGWCIVSQLVLADSYEGSCSERL